MEYGQLSGLMMNICIVLAIIACIAIGFGIITAGIYLFIYWWNDETHESDSGKVVKFIMCAFFVVALICVALILFIGLICGIIKNI